MVDNRAHIDIVSCVPNDTQSGILKYGTRYAERPECIHIYS